MTISTEITLDNLFGDGKKIKSDDLLHCTCTQFLTCYFGMTVRSAAPSVYTITGWLTRTSKKCSWRRSCM